MKMHPLNLILTLFLAGPVLASDFLDNSSLNGTGQEVVIDSTILDNVSHEEPVFSKRGRERDVARTDAAVEPGVYDWQGELVVLSEIPYSYPQLSRGTLEARVLNKIKEQESQSGQKK